MTDRFCRAGVFVFAALFALSLPTGAYADRFFVLPANAPASASAVVLDRTATDSEAGGTLIEGTNFSSFGATSGIGIAGSMFGMIGAGLAAGIAVAVVNNENRDRASHLGDFHQVDVRAALREAMPASAANPLANAHFELVPVVRTTFSDATHFKIDCLVNASFPMGERRWTGIFTAMAPGVYDTAAPETLTAAAAQVSPCMQEAYRAFTTSVDRAAAFEAPAKVSIAGGRPVNVRLLHSEDGQRTYVNLWRNMVTSYSPEQFGPPAPPPVVVDATTAAPRIAVQGQTVVTTEGVRLGRVARLAEDGAPELIFEGRMITIPSSTLSLSDGKLVTTLTRAQVAEL